MHPGAAPVPGARPRVGITSAEPHGAAGEPHPDVAKYVRAVRASAAEPVLLAPDVASLGAQLAAVDGVLFTGGADVDPARYGGRAEHANAQASEYRADRDAFEIALARAARERGVPIFGICRGLQVLNVAFGGTLVEDVREELGERYAIGHRQTLEDGRERSDVVPEHAVALVPGSRVTAIVGAASIPTNSMHHQSVRAPGDGLAVTGATADGVVEAMEGPASGAFLVAVQWHPEELLATDAPSRALFAAFVEAAARAAARPESRVRS